MGEHWMDLDAEKIKGERDADDVADRIHRADFVEVNLFDVDAVDGGFGFSEEHVEDLFGFVFDEFPGDSVKRL